MSSSNTHSVPQSRHNEISKLCLQCLETLPKKGKPNINEWTVLSCIVQEQNNTLKVIALGTGTKCIGQDKLSQDGDILNDSHAEVICRRVFLRYLYENLLNANGDLLVYNESEQIFHMKDNVKFHFFTTQVPCGDAAIFPKQDSSEFGNLIDRKRSCDQEESNSPKKIKLETPNDIHRTGGKCLANAPTKDLKLNGEHYHITGVVRTKPGRGVPTLSVSCSDKIAKWYHLGLQGALLSILIKNRIEISSFTVAGGTPFDKKALNRALFSRINITEDEVQETIGQSELGFAYSKMAEKRSCPASIAWLNKNGLDRALEVTVDGRLQGVTKKQLKIVGVSKICKRELFKMFIKVVEKYKINLDVSNLDFLSYKNAKLLAKDYQASWGRLKKTFNIWTIKDDIYQEFCIGHNSELVSKDKIK